MSIPKVKLCFLDNTHFIERINKLIFLSNNSFTTEINLLVFIQMLTWCKTLLTKQPTEQIEDCPYTSNNVYVDVTYYYKKPQCDLIYFNIESLRFHFVQLKDLDKILDLCATL